MISRYRRPPAPDFGATRGGGGSWPLAAFVLAAAAGGLAWWLWPRPGPATRPPSQNLPFDRLVNAVFTAEPADPNVPPELRLVRLPDVPGNAFVWGATGRDESGHVWVGVSFHGGPRPSARLIEYDPDADLAFERGDVLTELGRAGLLRPDDEQPKIHSHIVQAGDGHLYFASMDDTGDEGGPRAPRCGSHLWRLRLPERTWEHLAAVPEGLIAVAGGGDLIYALGYPDHKLVQFDLRTGKTHDVTVGSSGGHISRNFVADFRGHAYVPRLASVAGRVEATLVEYDPDLHELASQPLPHYLQGPADANHGITAFQHLADKSIVFATHTGRLFHLVPDEGRLPAQLTDLGWFHPKGEAYTSVMFTYSGTNTVVGVGRRQTAEGERDDWLCFDLRVGFGFAKRLQLPDSLGNPPRGVLLYGSQTRDRTGDCYLAGSYERDGRARPLLLRARPPAAGRVQGDRQK